VHNIFLDSAVQSTHSQAIMHTNTNAHKHAQQAYTFTNPFAQF